MNLWAYVEEFNGASFSGFADAAVDPIDFPVAPAYAVPKVRTGDSANLCFAYCIKITIFTFYMFICRTVIIWY